MDILSHYSLGFDGKLEEKIFTLGQVTSWQLPEVEVNSQRRLLSTENSFTIEVTPHGLLKYFFSYDEPTRTITFDSKWLCFTEEFKCKYFFLLIKLSGFGLESFHYQPYQIKEGDPNPGCPVP